MFNVTNRAGLLIAKFASLGQCAQFALRIEDTKGETVIIEGFRKGRTTNEWCHADYCH